MCPVVLHCGNGRINVADLYRFDRTVGSLPVAGIRAALLMRRRRVTRPCRQCGHCRQALPTVLQQQHQQSNDLFHIGEQWPRNIFACGPRKYCCEHLPVVSMLVTQTVFKMCSIVSPIHDRKMSLKVNFAAVHERKPWRKHSIHKTLSAAIDGPDGAKALLRKMGRVGGMWEKYGSAKCVFVWVDDAQTAQVFRVQDEGTSIEAATVAVDRVLQFNAVKGCSESEIEACFPEDAPEDEIAVVSAVTHVAGDEQENLDNLYPDQIDESVLYTEGYCQQITVNRYERSSVARTACLNYFGYVCQVCQIDFERRYGELGRGFIHVHHKVPVSEIGPDYQIDPVKDLIPVCPNCHAMLHWTGTVLDVEYLKGLIKD